MIRPLREDGGGGCHDNCTVVALRTVAFRSLGASEGAERRSRAQWISLVHIRTHTHGTHMCVHTTYSIYICTGRRAVRNSVTDREETALGQCRLFS